MISSARRTWASLPSISRVLGERLAVIPSDRSRIRRFWSRVPNNDWMPWPTAMDDLLNWFSKSLSVLWAARVHADSGDRPQAFSRRESVRVEIAGSRIYRDYTKSAGKCRDRIFTFQERTSSITCPCTSVSRKSRPPKRYDSLVWSIPSRCNTVACRSCTVRIPSIAWYPYSSVAP